MSRASGVLWPQLRRPVAPNRQACWAELEMRRRNVWKWRSFFPFLPLLFHGGRQLQRTLGGAAEGDKADWNETHSFKRYPSRKRVAILQRRSRMDPGHSEFLSINADPEGSLQVCSSVLKWRSSRMVTWFSLLPKVFAEEHWEFLSVFRVVILFDSLILNIFVSEGLAIRALGQYRCYRHEAHQTLLFFKPDM